MNWHEWIVFLLKFKNSEKTAACACIMTLIPPHRALTESLHPPVRILFGCFKRHSNSVAARLIARYPSHKNSAR